MKMCYFFMLNHYLSLDTCFSHQLVLLRHVGENQVWDCIFMQHFAF